MHQISHDIHHSIKKNEYYEIKIENVYDPSKFWIIINFQELEIFMNYLKYFYSEEDNLRIISRGDLKKNMLCIVWCNGMYYRSTVLPVLLPNRNAIRVFMFDYGHIVNVSRDNIFYINKKHCVVPRFAIRSSLVHISPKEDGKSWSQNDLRLFCTLIATEKLYAKIFEVDIERSILYMEIYTPTTLQRRESVNDTLININVASFNRSNNVTTNLNIDTDRKYTQKIKYPHIFPTFEELESGTVPSSLWESDLLIHSVQLDLLYRNYYDYKINVN